MTYPRPDAGSETMVHDVVGRAVTACLVLMLALAGASCADEGPDGSAVALPQHRQTSDAAGEAGATGAGEDAATRSHDAPLVVFLGDSLTAGYGLGEAQAFPALVASMLQDAGQEIRVINAGVSGDTSAGGLRRLDWLLQQDPDVVVLGLGANDGLRGQDLDATQSNLRAIIERCRDAQIDVVLLGMLMPPNYGEAYTQQFAQMYQGLAAEYDLARVPFLLDGVAGQPELNLPDGIHPNAQGQQIVAGNVLGPLSQVLEARAESATDG